MRKELSEKFYKSGTNKGKRIPQRVLDNLKLGRMSDEDFKKYKEEKGKRVATRRVKCSSRNCNQYTFRYKGFKYRCHKCKQRTRQTIAREWARSSRLRRTVMEVVRHLIPEIVEQIKNKL